MSSDAPVLGLGSLDAGRRAAAPGETFSHVLRERTKLVHRDAERSGFIADLIRGRATRDGYALYLRNLVPIYTALEAPLDTFGEHPPLAAFADPRLRRLEALRCDLDAIDGPDWHGRPVVVEARAYAAAITRVAGGDGARLTAHAYARYMGDLSGGQILATLLARNLGLGAHQLRFYAFPAFADVEAPKIAMRRALDEVAPGSPPAEAIVDEALAAFRHTIAMSIALSHA